MTDLIWIEAVLPRNTDKLWEYCNVCNHTHYMSECRFRNYRAEQLRTEVAKLRQKLADLSGEIA